MRVPVNNAERIAPWRAPFVRELRALARGEHYGHAVPRFEVSACRCAFAARVRIRDIDTVLRSVRRWPLSVIVKRAALRNSVRYHFGERAVPRYVASTVQPQCRGKPMPPRVASVARYFTAQLLREYFWL
jgi:hypothetical protein